METLGHPHSKQRQQSLANQFTLDILPYFAMVEKKRTSFTMKFTIIKFRWQIHLLHKHQHRDRKSISNVM